MSEFILGVDLDGVCGGHAIAVADTVAWLDDHSIPSRDLCFRGE